MYQTKFMAVNPRHATWCADSYTGGPHYMQTFYQQFRIYAIEIMALQRNANAIAIGLVTSKFVTYMRTNFLGSNLLHITRAACTVNIQYTMCRICDSTLIAILYRIEMVVLQVSTYFAHILSRIQRRRRRCQKVKFYVNFQGELNGLQKFILGPILLKLLGAY